MCFQIHRAPWLVRLPLLVENLQPRATIAGTDRLNDNPLRIGRHSYRSNGCINVNPADKLGWRAATERSEARQTD